MKRVLIISPYFPPSNAADMQRIRMSLPYFKAMGWEAEIVSVHPVYSDTVKDDLLYESIPSSTIIHLVKAFSKKWTSYLGLGSIALRSMWFYRAKVNVLLKEKKIDLIYFSTTQFPVCILGSYWKKRFGVPYVIDMQDPWHSDYYRDKPKDQRPAKYWFSYRLNKWLEPLAMKDVGGLISVSEKYITVLKERYPILKMAPSAVITFGADQTDFNLVDTHNIKSVIPKKEGTIIIAYVGRGGSDMNDSLQELFTNFKIGLKNNPDLYRRVQFHFIGTSYAPSGKGKQTILPLATEMKLADHVFEKEDRISFYEGLATLKQADGLIVLGSNDAGYTASKLYPYILSKRPLLGILLSSSLGEIFKKFNAGYLVTMDNHQNKRFEQLNNFIIAASQNILPATDWMQFKYYDAENTTKRQCDLFDQVIFDGRK